MTKKAGPAASLRASLSRRAASVRAPDRDDRGGTDIGTKVSASVGIIAAMVLATVVNLLVARHYRRWDVTRGGLNTLSDATLAILHALSEPIALHVLLPSGEPLTLSVEHLLDAYDAESSELVVDFVDPDRRPAEFLALARRYGIDAQRADGRLVAGAAAIITRGDRFEIIQQNDLVQVEDEEDLRRRPRIEQAFTGALRAVVSTEHPKACFTRAHGEMEAHALRTHLVRSGYEIEAVEPNHDATAARSPDDCTLLVIAAPTERVSPPEVARYEHYLNRGGSALVVVGARPDGSDRGYEAFGLAGLLEVVGMKLDADFVFETSPELRLPGGRGETFQPSVRPHAVTQRLLHGADRSLAPVVTMASSFSPIREGSAATTPLLVTSREAFGMVDFFTWAQKNIEANKTAADLRGPLTVAFAAELPKPQGAPHGGRLVAVGAASVIVDDNWSQESFRGTAVFVEGAIAWLTERPVLDIPEKPLMTAGLRVSDAWLAATFRYVVLYMPLAAILLGAAVQLRRRDKRKPERKASGEAR